MPPTCVGCGCRLPAGEPVGWCPACFAALPWWDKSRILPPELPDAVSKLDAPWLYDGLAREVILRLKFADGTALAPILAKALRGVEIPDGAVIVPVPMHASRLRERMFNQAALLAWEMGKLWHRDVMVDGLVRLTRTDGQARKVRSERLRLAGTDFKASTAVEGKTVVLVDDIFTTGSTAKACALALRRAGAADVRVVTLAYTPPGGL